MCSSVWQFSMSSPAQAVNWIHVDDVTGNHSACFYKHQSHSNVGLLSCAAAQAKRSTSPSPVPFSAQVHRPKDTAAAARHKKSQSAPPPAHKPVQPRPVSPAPSPPRSPARKPAAAQPAAREQVDLARPASAQGGSSGASGNGSHTGGGASPAAAPLHGRKRTVRGAAVFMFAKQDLFSWQDKHAPVTRAPPGCIAACKGCGRQYMLRSLRMTARVLPSSGSLPKTLLPANPSHAHLQLRMAGRVMPQADCCAGARGQR